MRSVLVSLVAGILSAMALAQSPAASQTTSPAAKVSLGQTAASGAIVAELAKSVDARKVKPDDKIEARLTMDVLAHGEIAIPRGTKIIGHVTDARARTKQAPESMVEIAFDCIILKNGSEIPLKATIQAVGAPVQTSAPASSDLTGQGQGQGIHDQAIGPNEMRALRTATPGSLRPAYAETGAEEPMDSDGRRKNLASSLGPTSHGVFGMKGIALSNTAHGSAISSTSENVHLSSGTQLVLRVAEPLALTDSLQRRN
jgi:hypothetical protein